MTREDIIRMAREAGFPCIGDRPILASGEEAMIRFAALVAAASASVEREACAKLIESTDLGALKDDPKLQNWIAALLFSYAAAIRARSQQ
jgi:hypothetical protein